MGATCKHWFVPGTVVTLTRSGTGNCVVKMSAAKSVTAKFTR
jgi:hypothetical protein